MRSGKTMMRVVGLAVVSLCMTRALAQDPGPSLRQAAGGRVAIGAAIPARAVDDPRLAALVAREFASITAENEMKPQSLQPQPGQFNFEPADRIVAFAQQHNIEVIGHTLIWHAQSPRWMFEDENGKPLPRDVALKNMQDHITAVMHHYKGKVKGWDVVNEAVSDGPEGLRSTPALRAIGDDYILKAFEFAHAADPDAELYYNDYNIDHDYKRQRGLDLVKRIRDAGLRIDGVGIQGHYLLGAPSIEEIERGIKAYVDAGFKVMITELDVDPLPRSQRGGADLSASEREGVDPYRNGLPDDMQQKLADRYRALFELFLRYPTITRITLWGTTDAHTWLNNFPVQGRTNHPMLWDRQFNPKPAYDAVRQTLIAADKTPATPTTPTTPTTQPGASLLPARFEWITGPELIPPPADPERPVISIKDPTVVRHDDRWHVFATVARATGWQMVYLSFDDWPNAAAATPFFMDRNPNLRAYHCAPQVFYFEPHAKWYLIFQSQHPQYSTADDLADPMSWTRPQNFFDRKPDTVGQLWIDYWIICDDTHAYLFFTGDDGKFYRSRTTLAEFPKGMSEPVVVMEEANRFHLFEGSATYRIKGAEQYLTLIEAIGPEGIRFYRAFVASKLDGDWRAIADTWDRPFAGVNNVRFADGVTPWTEDISHGELIRDGNDQTMTIDPQNLQLLFQGRPASRERIAYLELPYRLGLLKLKHSE